MHGDDAGGGEVTEQHPRDTEWHCQQGGDLGNGARHGTHVDDHAAVVGGEHLVKRRADCPLTGGHKGLDGEVMAGPSAPTGVRIRPNQRSRPGHDHLLGALGGLLGRGLARRRGGPPVIDDWRTSGVKLLGTLGFPRGRGPEPRPDGPVVLAVAITLAVEGANKINGGGGGGGRGGGGGGGPARW